MARARFTSSESGFALIEAVVSAAVLAVIAMAVLSGIDAASNSSGREKARAVAATLAEQDQERMRSMDVDTLAAVPQQPPITIDGAEYKVVSKAEWITDDQGGTPACGNSSKNNEYLHITTTVTSTLVGTRTKPVVIDSLAAPSTKYSSTHGILGVKVVDRNGVGVGGVTVTAASTSPSVSLSDNTDPNGCVVFRQIPVATYTITANKPGYVGTDLSPTVTTTSKATPGTITFKTVEYDIATTARLSFKTWIPGTTPVAANRKDTTPAKVSLTNAKATGLLKRYAAANPIDIAPLYPFKSTAYAFFTGTCDYQSPDTFDVNYFGSYPGSLVMDPTKPQPQTTTVLQPPLNVQITRNYNADAFTTSNLQVFATLQKSASTDTCTEPQVPLYWLAWPGWGTAPATGGYWLSDSSTTFDPGMPYGQYTICVRDSKNATKRYQSFTYDNTKAAATTFMANTSQPWTTTNCVAP